MCGAKGYEFKPHYPPNNFIKIFMNYRKKKKLFQQLIFFKLQRDSNFIMCFQANTINSLNRNLLTKELNKSNLKLQIYQTKLLRQKKFIFEEIFVKNVYSGLFLVLTTNSVNYLNNIKIFFKLLQSFKFLMPICVMFLNRLFFCNHLQKFLQIHNIQFFFILILLIRVFTLINILKLRL